MTPETTRVDILDKITAELDANTPAMATPDAVVDIGATVDAMLDRMFDGPDDGRAFLRRTFAFNATTERLEREKQATERYEWMCGYTDLEPFNEFFMRAAAVTAVAGTVLAFAGVKAVQKIFRK